MPERVPTTNRTSRATPRDTRTPEQRAAEYRAEREAQIAADARITELRAIPVAWDIGALHALRDAVVFLYFSAGSTGDDVGRRSSAQMINQIGAEMVRVLGSEDLAIEVIEGRLQEEQKYMKCVAPLRVPVPELPDYTR